MGLENPIHILLLLVVVLLVFGAKRLPEMGRSLGTGLRGFRESMSAEATVGHLEAAPQAIASTSAQGAATGEPSLVR